MKTASLPLVPPPSEGPAAKKRKIQNGGPEVTAQAPADIKGDAPIQFYVQDISFAIPQRKKLTLEVTAGSRYLRARNQATKEVEFGIPMDRIRKTIPLCFLFSLFLYVSGFKSIFGNEVSLMLFNANLQAMRCASLCPKRRRSNSTSVLYPNMPMELRRRQRA